MKKEIKMICDKCGKEPEMDNEKSNENWKVYKNEPCKCGGTFKFSI